MTQRNRIDLRKPGAASAAVMALCCMLLGNLCVISFSQAPADAKHAKPTTEDPSTENFKKGKALYAQGDLDGAIDALLQSVYFARNNYAPASYFLLGSLYCDTHQDPKAIDALTKAVQQNVGGLPEAHVILAKVHLRNDRIKEAEDECNEAFIAANAPYPPADFQLAKVCEAKKDWGNAQYHYTQALGDRPWSYTEAWMGMAECDMAQKHWSAAVVQFNDMMKSKKLLKGLDHEKLYNELGACCLALGDHQSAVDNWHRAMDWNQDSPDAHLQLAMLFDAENHLQSALKEYKEFIKYSKDAGRVAKAKQRVNDLQNKVGAPESEPIIVKPSPYMRGAAGSGAQRGGFDTGSVNAGPGAGAGAGAGSQSGGETNLPKDSGF